MCTVFLRLTMVRQEACWCVFAQGQEMLMLLVQQWMADAVISVPGFWRLQLVVLPFGRFRGGSATIPLKVGASHLTLDGGNGVLR